ncbi:MAG: YDG domain-containing protein, partial [Herbaspirillum sp.]
VFNGGGTVGGLVGFLNSGTVNNSYATGVITTTAQDVGGLVGLNYGGVNNSFWDTTTSGQATSDGGVGMTTANMKSLVNFTSATAANGNVNPNWGFASTWVMYDGHTSPLLRSFLTPLTVTANAIVKSYDGLTSVGSGSIYSTAPNGNLLGTLDYSGAKNAGVYAASGLYSNQQGYLINYVNGLLTVNQANLTLSPSNVSKTYDGDLSASSTATVTGGTLFGSDALSGGTFAFTDKNVGNGNKTVTASGVTINDGNGGGNYNVSYAANSTSTIAPKALTMSDMTANNKTYDGNTIASLSGGMLSGLVGAETLTFSGQTGAFIDKNVGSNKAVTVTGLMLGNGTGLASNYSVSSPIGLSAKISRLDTVAWVGGPTGNWFDPANWANQAVPDLANVANVLIPSGVSINFDPGTVVGGAQAGAVMLDSIGNSGGLRMVDGNLNVAGNLQLANLDQLGGTIDVDNNATLGVFSQSNGALEVGHNLIATEAFQQNQGTVVVGANADITQRSGSPSLGNLNVVGGLNANALNGDIVQVDGTHIAATSANLTAPNGSIVLSTSGNDLGNTIANSSSTLPIQSAIASAQTTLGGSPLRIDESSNSSSAYALVGGDTSSGISGLNLTITGQGINMPSDK